MKPTTTKTLIDIVNKANAIFKAANTLDKEYMSAKEVTQCQKLTTRAINLAEKAIAAGTPASMLDFYL